MLEEQHPLYKEKLYFDLVGMHWIPDKKCVFVVAFHFHPFWTPSVHGFRPPSSFTKPRMLNAFVTWEDTLRGCGWCFLQTSTVRKTHLPSQFWGAVLVAKLGPNLGSMMNSIWHRKNDQLANVSQWNNRGISWSKSLAFILLQNAPRPRNPLRLEKIPPGTPNFEGDESYGVSVAQNGPGCFTGNSKTTYIPFDKTTRPVLNHLHKGHRSCYEKSTNPELSHCFLELSTVESPGIRDSVRILGGHRFQPFQRVTYNPRKGQVCADLPSSKSFFGSQKGVFHS